MYACPLKKFVFQHLWTRRGRGIEKPEAKPLKTNWKHLNKNRQNIKESKFQKETFERLKQQNHNHEHSRPATHGRSELLWLDRCLSAHVKRLSSQRAFATWIGETGSSFFMGVKIFPTRLTSLEFFNILRSKWSALIKTFLKSLPNLHMK